MSSVRDQLRDLIDRDCLFVGGEYELSTGIGSDYYFDCKKVTLDGHGLSMVVDLVSEEIANLPERPDAIGGLTIGADPIIAGVIVRDPTIKGSIVRKEPKEHGTKNKIENQLAPGSKFVVVDDVVTSGRSIRMACSALIEAGFKVIGIIALVDREKNGIENLRKEYGRATALYTKSEFPKLQEISDDNNQPQTAVA